MADYFNRNRKQVIKAALIILAAIILGCLLAYGFSEWQAARFQKRVDALERQYQEAEAEKRAAQDRADALERQIEINKGEYAALKRQADAADKRVGETTIVYRTVKEAYEVVRDNPVIPACVSYADACRELAGLGFQCR